MNYAEIEINVFTNKGKWIKGYYHDDLLLNDEVKMKITELEREIKKLIKQQKQQEK